MFYWEHLSSSCRKQVHRSVPFFALRLRLSSAVHSFPLYVTLLIFLFCLPHITILKFLQFLPRLLICVLFSSDYFYWTLPLTHFTLRSNDSSFLIVSIFLKFFTLLQIHVSSIQSYPLSFFTRSYLKSIRFKTFLAVNKILSAGIRC